MIRFIAEAGVEQALYCLNNVDDPQNPWVGNGQIKPTPLECEGDCPEIVGDKKAIC